jgi:hypothetical protein
MSDFQPFTLDCPIVSDGYDGIANYRRLGQKDHAMRLASVIVEAVEVCAVNCALRGGCISESPNDTTDMADGSVGEYLIGIAEAAKMAAEFRTCNE